MNNKPCDKCNNVGEKDYGYICDSCNGTGFVSIEHERGHFLDEKQKEVKQKIMEDLLDSIFGNLKKNFFAFENDPQAVSDLIFSVLVMFNREMLVHFIRSYNIQNRRKDLMKELFQAIKDEVNKKFVN